MKKIFIPIALCATMLFSMTSCTNSTPKIETTKDTLSWAMGRSLAEGLVQNSGLELDNKVIIEAIHHTLDGKEQPLSDSVYQMAVQYIQMNLMMQQQKEMKEKTANIQKNEADVFAKLETEHPNIQKTKSGIYYEVMKQGNGPKAKYGEIVVFDYRGYNMLTGQMTDQTYGQHDPIQHVVGQPMFAGLIEGLQLMNNGCQIRFYFPNRLAFGANGATNIPPYTPVIYEVELHKIIR